MDTQDFNDKSHCLGVSSRTPFGNCIDAPEHNFRPAC